MALLTVHDLSKSFGGVQAVDGVSFALHPAERLALIGPNGAGKTTCFNLIGGQIKPDRGEIWLSGHSMMGLLPRQIGRLGVGRTFQITATFASMTVQENVQMALISHHRRILDWIPYAYRLYRSEALALLERVKMAEQAHRLCGILAYGDLKRLELAVALAQQPQLLLMDEPTAGMARQERLELMQLISQIVQEQAIGVLFTEHDMDVVFGYADRVLVLDRGRLLATGSPAEIRANPEVQSIYLG
ncbi:MAG: ABC transporter ATP-binding protein, partial [Synechococcaceae cyanobacterium RM1_1_27]|nr:ABC transporter ATP-binding protein [Synechococcaceae cyanobacterium RM1_1_27]